MFPVFKILAQVVTVIPAGRLTGEHEFNLQINNQTVMRSHLSEPKVQNLMTLASAAICLETFAFLNSGPFEPGGNAFFQIQ